TARQFVRFVNAALQRAARMPPRTRPLVAAQIAISDAARDHLPGLVPFLAQLTDAAPTNRALGGDSSSGQWVRQGSSIVIDLG
ncbi:MAG: hypothetical protein ACXVVQ_20965, partial [Solirubrobacteraceae bacterium]